MKGKKYFDSDYEEQILEVNLLSSPIALWRLGPHTQDIYNYHIVGKWMLFNVTFSKIPAVS